MLFKLNKKSKVKIGVIQSCRIAAISVARRIAFEMDACLSGLVGYKIRFTNATTESTRFFQ